MSVFKFMNEYEFIEKRLFKLYHECKENPQYKPVALQYCRLVQKANPRVGGSFGLYEMAQFVKGCINNLEPCLTLPK